MILKTCTAFHVVGVISLLILAVAVYARYPAHLGGVWRWIYVATAVGAKYLNVFVLVAWGIVAGLRFHV